jgi:hypothetical protein
MTRKKEKKLKRTYNLIQIITKTKDKSNVRNRIWVHHKSESVKEMNNTKADIVAWRAKPLIFIQKGQKLWLFN